MYRFLPLLLALGCGTSPDDTSVTETTPTECAIGAVNCACTPGGACDGDLLCEEGICILEACPIGTLDCACTDGGACDPGLDCFEEVCEVPPVCGNGVVERGEGCDDDNTVTEVCDYGVESCQVCDDGCQTVAGATSFCGDGQLDSAEESCDDPSDDGACDYGELSCEVCNPATCELVSGSTAFCGDGVIHPREDCDGGAMCESGCDFIGESFEPNNDLGDAIEVFVRSNGTFSHPVDVVHGPGSQSSPSLFQDPDYFVIEDLCAYGTLTARIEFDHTIGTLDMLFGRREGFGTSTGPPPVYFNWFADDRFQDFQEMTLDAPSSVKDHYIRIEADDDSRTYIINSYTLTGSVSCP